MARLALMFCVLKKARKLELKQKRTQRRLVRYMDRAFSLGDEEFMENYRVSKHLFEAIYDELKYICPPQKRRSDICLKHKILATLSFYATGGYQRLVGDTYGALMSQQSVSRAIREVTRAVNKPEVFNKWIRFPKCAQERNAIKKRFFEKYSIPGVLGCIDGTHVSIIRPKENKERFLNRKNFHSKNVLLICDADLNILSVDSSFGGASHDNVIWNQHPVKNHLIDLNNSGEIVYLLGDTGYAQSECMMIPILDAPAGSPEEYYTRVHSSARDTIERTVRVLKSRWRCLLRHRVLHYNPDVSSEIINACCVLHNMCNNRLPDQNLEDIDFNVETIHSELPECDRASVGQLRRGLEKRAALIQKLWVSR